ncbi:acyltransferase [Micromonospora sp. WMMD882]|uniref:acyltransferase family protein n=1 Tax=Micromonospora sp. WMMD882 TaxID=3015151 RepID=UPI00248B6804|nr:acyltransferase [Micromonospora sp. WMMD882]WBB81892.1 acyltransferase [Micromonospora sp. WMMD882]
MDTLTGARFLAAFMVFLFHIATLSVFAPESWLGGSLPLLTRTAGAIGVSFFFVLSGFVLTWSVRPGDTYLGFLRRRLVKIFPNHLVTYAMAMLLFAATSTGPVTALLNALLLQSWAPDVDVFLSVNGPSWSLSCELLFYLAFPVLLPVVSRISADRLWLCAGAVVLVIAALPTAAHLLLPAEPTFGEVFDGTILEGQSVPRLWSLYIFPPSRLLDFGLGMLMARIVLSGRWIRLPVTAAALLTAGGYLLGTVTPMTYTVDAATIVPLALLIAALAVAERGDGVAAPRGGVHRRTVSGWLGHPVMRRLGELSFAFYLVHELVLILLRAGVGFDRHLSTTGGLLLALCGLLLSVGLAYLLHTFVELPAVRRWGRFRRVLPPTAGPAGDDARPRPAR